MIEHPPIVLTTDFGLADPYVGVMKGVILSINPQATILDLTHQIQLQDLRQAAFILANSYRYFPNDTIQVTVVDPGVGTSRKAVLLETPTARFLAPDNGLLSEVLAGYMAESLPSGDSIPVPAGCLAYQLTNQRYWLQPVSSTFHGRDIFAPVAAHLSLGVEPTELGEPLDRLVWRPLARPVPEDEGTTGEVVYADRFGNLITNITRSILGETEPVVVQVKGHRIEGLSTTFHGDDGAAEGRLLAMIGSNGYLEIAVADGSAAELLGVEAGEVVTVTRWNST